MPKKDTDFSEADFKKEVNKILKSMDVPLDPDGNYPEEVKELWPAIQSKLGKKLLAKNWRVWTTMWTNVIGPTYVSAAKEAAKYAGVKYRGEIGSFAKKYHRDHGLALCKTLTETDLQRVQDQIVDNWGIGEKAFEKKFQDDYIGSEARLKAIYRSEHARAISEGTLEVGQEVGHTYKQWWCSEDERSCEICMAHHEEVVPMDEAFSGGFAIPQDSHPSCRCVLITLEESDLSDDQKARMASRDPISLDDLDPTFQDSPWKSNEAFRQVLNYKCPENSHGPGFSCGGEEGSEEDEYTPEEHKKALEAEQFVKSKFSSEIEVGDCHFLDVSPSIPIYTKHFRAYIDTNPDKLDNPKDVAKLSAIDNAEKLCTKYKLDLGEIHLVENRKHGIVGASDPLSDRIIISIGKDMLKDPEKVKQIAIIEEKMGIPYSTIDNNKPFDKVLNDVLVHEVAHNLLLEYEYDNNDFYKMPDKPISVYAMTNPHESFAENFVAKQNGQSLDDYNEQYIANVMAWSKNKKEPEDDE